MKKQLQTVKIINDWPPGATFEDRKIKNIITNYEGAIYLCDEKDVRDDLIEHERIHIKQQNGDYHKWIEKYQNDEQFRMKQEIEAYQGQLRFIKQTKGIHHARIAKFKFANFLVNEIYQFPISFEEALNKLKI
jgi:hypothetical protein